MHRGSRPSLTPSRQGSNHSTDSKGSAKDYALSLNIYGDGDTTREEVLPAHWGAMLHKRGGSNGDLHHVRKQDAFFYDDPVPTRPLESTTSYGRSEVLHLSSSRKEAASKVLHSYGRDKSNLPSGVANCQDWTVGALGALEQGKLAPKGTSKYWGEKIGNSSATVAQKLQRDGGSWIPKTASKSERQGPADATYGRKTVSQPTGRLDMSKFAGLSGGGKSKR